MINSIAWIHWNPPRELFTVPLIDRPIAIYGFCFVLGFILAYFILSWMFRQVLLQSKSISEQEVFSWKALIKELQIATCKKEHPLYSVLSHLDEKVQEEIANLQLGQELNAKQKDVVLKAITLALQSKITRKELEESFPLAFSKAKQTAYFLTDKLTWYVVLGTIIGARLGHVFFYEWPRYQDNWLDIFKIWEGGLASHGGVLGVFIAVLFYYRKTLKSYKEFSLFTLMDCMVVPAGLAAGFIRIGNFFNQEILGPPTFMPWGIIFEDPADGGLIVPRHPTQLYEAIAYFLIFGFLLFLWKNSSYKEQPGYSQRPGSQRPGSQRPGFFSGLFFILLFTFRFFIEFLKSPQHSLVINESFLQAGQILSIPFILAGLFLFFFGQKIENYFKKKTKNTLLT